MADETTPDAVEMLQRMHACVVLSENHGDVPRIGSDEVLAVLRATQDERARHAEEVARLRDVHLDETRALDDLRLKEIASLRDQLRRVEGEREEALRMVDVLRKSEKTARESMVINMRLRDEAQAENVQLKAELTSLRSLLPDVRACAEYIVERGVDNADGSARRILAALASQGGEGE